MAYSQPLFLQKEGKVYKEGAEAPPSQEKGGSRQFFEGLPAKVLIPKILTEFSFGIGMVNTEKYRPIPTEKYRLGIQL
jgi:hypothetical protein